MRTVLVLDDLESYLRALDRTLRDSFEIVSARSVEEALGSLTPKVDVCLIDVRLSETDPDNREGIEFVRTARKRMPDLPIVMMSAYHDFEAAVQSVNLGADYFVEKPLNLRRLREQLLLFADVGRDARDAVQALDDETAGN